jgi:hypothetical protein
MFFIRGQCQNTHLSISCAVIFHMKPIMIDYVKYSVFHNYIYIKN